ncbi:hypothetical protein KSC_066080 [Ktedonobacter sp. SOSP1-52]|uniref:hypothetical protein n=1 Tax=Ktedonobacter sp. SOSP1-52 TaxID=2778366 RepID=UPI0019161C09|nr:hypothetical protein [Ktedonobacter sp. SOSP1-52]GHO67716.1 hypothetical protein KSC_066080 [Ktedonobacter sp. SOSP1-52]
MNDNIIHALVVQSKLAGDRSIAVSLYSDLIDMHPLLKTNEGYKRTTGYFLLGPHFRDEDTGYVLYPSTMIAQHMGVPYKHANTTRHLDDYKRDIAPSLEYSGYSKKDKKCRAILDTGMTELIDAVLEEKPEKKKYFYSGVVANEKNQLALDKQVHQEAKQQAFFYSDQRLIAGYLHRHPFSTFKRPVEENYEEARALARTAGMPKQRRHLLLQLQATRDNPKPYYYPVENNARIYSQSGLILMPKELRRTLWPGLFEGDLQSAQAGIMATLWGANLTSQILQDDVSLWDELMNQMGIVPEHKARAKPIVKQGYYSVGYGMKTGDVNRKVGTELGKVYIKRQKDMRFSDSAIMTDLLQARERTEARILKEGGMYGAYGWMPYYGQAMPSFHSHVLQTYELAIVAECFKVASDSQDFRIMYYQWDGFSFSVAPSREKRVVTSLQNAVQKKAREYGIYTKLVVE